MIIQNIGSNVSSKALAVYTAARAFIFYASWSLVVSCLVFGAIEGSAYLKGVRQELLQSWLSWELGNFDTAILPGSKLVSDKDLTKPLESQRQLLAALVKVQTCQENLSQIKELSNP